jgi:hypothetical protein
MKMLSKLLSSKTIQGILVTVGGALVKFAETSYPEYSKVIDMLSIALITGGSVHGIYGRIMAAGPILLKAATQAAEIAAPQLAPVIEVAAPLVGKAIESEIEKKEAPVAAPEAPAVAVPVDAPAAPGTV